MIEVWKMTGSFWTLPIGVRTSEMGILMAAPLDGFPYLRMQIGAILSRLKKQSTGEIDGWQILNAKDLAMMATPALDQDPEHIVSWHPDTKTHWHDPSFSEEDFLETTIVAGAFESMPEAKVKWMVILRCVLHWILVRGKILDLKFARIAVVPWRANWKPALVSITEMHGINYSDPKWLDKAMDFIASPELLASVGSDRLTSVPGIELVPDKWFFKNAMRMEQERTKTLAKGYWYSVANRMIEMSEFGREALSIFMAQMRRAHPFTWDGDAKGSDSIPQGWRELEDMVDTGWRSCKIPLAIDRRTGFEVEAFFESVARPEKGLPTVPDI